jgi:hypothetical protein
MMRIGTARTAWLTRAVLLGVLGSAPRAGAVVTLYVGTATGVPGGTPTFDVVMTTTGEQVAAVGNTITFDPLTPIASCAINPLLFPTWSWEPSGCIPLVNCTYANFIALGQQLGGAIPNGTTLYNCTVDIASSADTTTYPLMCSNASAGDLARNTLQVQCSNGQVQVVPVLVAHALQGATTLTLTSPAPTSPVFDDDGFPTAGKIIQIDGTSGLSIGYTLESDNITLMLLSTLPVNVQDGTEITLQPLPTPTPTATTTPTPTATPAPKGGGGGGGCQITAIGQTYTGLLLMMPVVWLWWRRRRSCR